MTIQLTPEELDVEMRYYRREFGHEHDYWAGKTLEESPHEWHFGGWSLSKHSKQWRIGYGHPLREGACWVLYPFTWHGQPYLGLVFDSAGGEPPRYMVGWKRPNNEEWATWMIEFLNGEIADRLAGKVSKYDGRVGLHKDRQDAMYEEEWEEERRREAAMSPFLDEYHRTRVAGERASESDFAQPIAVGAGPVIPGWSRMVFLPPDHKQPGTTRDFEHLADAIREADELTAADHRQGAYVYDDAGQLIHQPYRMATIGKVGRKVLPEQEGLARDAARNAGAIAPGMFRMVVIDLATSTTTHRDFANLIDAVREANTIGNADEQHAAIVFTDTLERLHHALHPYLLGG